MKRVKHLLSTDWNKAAVDILREELENLDKDQTATFFDSVATLMANQVRELITKSVNAYVDFFRRFRKPNNEYPTPKEIMTREFDPDTPLEDNFIILTLNVNNTNQIVFTDPIIEVRDQLMNLVNEIIKQSEYLPRPENTIARSDKLHLWHVPEDDELVRNAKNEIHEILE
jgi:16S rRNA G966 N2-methylase RsmD